MANGRSVLSRGRDRNLYLWAADGGFEQAAFVGHDLNRGTTEFRRRKPAGETAVAATATSTSTATASATGEAASVEEAPADAA